MFGSAILETAIGLVLIYLLLSLICSSAREAIEAVMKSRASMLEKGIGELLRTPVGGTKAPGQPPNSNLVSALYNHPLIYSLYRGEYQPGGSNLPSYIPSRNFALALMDLVVRGPLRTSDELPAAEHAAVAVAGSVASAISEVAASTPAAAASSTNPELQAAAVATARVASAYLPSTKDRALSIAGVAEALASSSDLTIHAKRAVQIALETANNDFAQAQRNIEAWYDSAMDRVSGWYKHQSQKYLFLLGLGLTVIANVDTVALGKALYLQPSVREALVTEASVVRRDSTFRTGAVAADSVVRTLEQLDLPLGWNNAQYHSNWYASANNVATFVIEPALGWLLTALAISLGAPFWFDMLNRIMVVRSTVKPQEKSPDQTASAPQDDGSK